MAAMKQQLNRTLEKTSEQVIGYFGDWSVVRMIADYYAATISLVECLATTRVDVGNAKCQLANRIARGLHSI